MTLKSDLFTKPPSAALSSCAKNDSDHIMEGVNDQGDHVGRIQTALIRLREGDPSLQLPPISVVDLGNTKYGKSTAACVLKYKQKRGIVNPRYQTKADNIVGIMTIDRLDKDMFAFQNRPSVPDLPIPPIDPTPIPPAITRRIVRRSFSKLDTVKTSGDPRNEDAKEQADAVFGLIFGSLSPEFALGTLPTDPPQIASFLTTHRVNRVTTVVDVDVQLLKGGQGMLTITHTIISYEWGPPLPNVILVNTEKVMVFGDSNPPSTSTKALPRAAAEKTPLVVPPNPP